MRTRSRSPTSWATQSDRYVYGWRDQRLYDLALALIIPWRDGWPRYWMDETNEQRRMDEILEATKDQILPWSLS